MICVRTGPRDDEQAHARTALRRRFRTTNIGGALAAFWAALVLIGMLLSGCGGGGSTATSMSSSEQDADGTDDREGVVEGPGESAKKGPAAHAESVTTAAVVKVTPMPELGKVVVNSDGMTMYVFHRDNPMLYQFEKDPTPSCYEDCAEVWPPVLTGPAPKAKGDAERTMLGTITRRDGTTQVTYDEHPLYTYVKDVQPGEANGDDVDSFESEWHALDPQGEEP